METTPILLADDHRIMLDGIESLLQGSPYTIAALCANGQEAWNWLQMYTGTIQIVITDISMPVMDGITLCRNIKQQYPDIRVLLLSMYSSTTAIEEALQAEADGFILKNASKEEFLNALHRLRNGSTFFSAELLPLLHKQVAAERKRETAQALLSEREQEILALIAEEYTSDEIAGKLFISKKTVDNHRANMLLKTGSRSTIGLVKFAIRNGLIAS